MSWKKKLCLFTLAALIVGLAAPDALAKKKKKKKGKEPKIATGPMDDGKLIPSWFGEGLAFMETDEIDYLWVKEGFELEGQSLHMQEWGDPEFLGEDGKDRDANDKALARRINADMHNIFADGLGDELEGTEISTESGDIAVIGRIVDCSTGSVAAKALVGFGAGAGNVTVDVKFTDKASGELVMAIHHRVVSGTNWSTSDSKFIKWVRKMAEELADDGVQEAYRRGDPRDD